MSVSDPIILRYLIDQGLSAGSMRAIWIGVGAYLLILALRMLAEVTDQTISIRLRAAVAANLRGSCIDAILRGGIPQLKQYEKGDLTARVTQDAKIVEDTVARTIPLNLFSLMVIAAHGVVLLTFDWRLASLMLLLVPLQPLAFRLFARRVERATADERQAESRLYSSIGQIAAGAVNIRALQAGDLFRGRFQAALAAAMAALRRRRLVGFLGPGLAELIIGAVRFGAILGLGAAFVRSGGTTVGTVMAFFAFSGRLVAPIAGIQRFLASLREGAVSLSRLRELTARMGADGAGWQAESRVSPGGGPPALVAEGLTYAYPGAAGPALRDVSLSLPRGRKIAVVGENGSGKTTLGLILGGLLKPTGGTVAMIGEETLRAHSPRQEILYVPGDAFLFPGSVRENLQVGRDCPDRELLAALEAVGAEFVTASETGLGSPVAEDGGNLSAGQRQKLSVARALARRPSFLILDEATSSFDPPSEAGLHAWLADQDMGLCLITHNVKNVLWVDEVIVLGGGEIAERGAPAALLARTDSELSRLLRSPEGGG